MIDIVIVQEAPDFIFTLSIKLAKINVETRYSLVTWDIHVNHCYKYVLWYKSML